MPTTYVRQPGSRNYHNYSQDTFLKAVDEVKEKHITYRDAFYKYGIPIATISRRINNKHDKHYVGQNVLLSKEKAVVVETILYAADWRYPEISL